MSASKKILLLTPYNQYATGARQLASVLHAQGYSAKLLILKDFSLSVPTPVSDEEWQLCKTAIEEYAPDLIAVSMTSVHVIDEPFLFTFLRSAAPQALLICGGFGPTFNSLGFLNFGADYVVRGEGEGAILDIARELNSGGCYTAIPNMAWVENGELKENPLRPLIDLDTIPGYMHGDEHIIYIENNMLRHVDPMLTLCGHYLINTSRGCVGKCTYCSGGNWLSIYQQECGHIKRYRTRAVELIMQECENAKKKGATYFHFLDEYFVRPDKEFEHFFLEYKNRINTPLGLMVHTGFIEKNEKRFDVFFKSGIHDVEIGIQSASHYISKDVFRRKISPEAQLRTINKFFDHWIATGVDFITGHILESEQDYQDTLRFIKELPFDPSWPQRTYVQVFSLGLLPGAIIDTLYPVLREQDMPLKEKHFRMRMGYLRHILKDDEEFFAIYNNQFLRQNPDLIKTIYEETYMHLLHQFWHNTLARLADKKVYFWGAEEVYQTHKHMFRQCKPQAILLDVPTSKKELDGIPVHHPDDILCTGNSIPIIMFAQNTGVLATKILRNYPDYNDLIACRYTTVFKPLFMA